MDYWRELFYLTSQTQTSYKDYVIGASYDKVPVRVLLTAGV